MNSDQIFQMAVNASKAQAFDYLASALAEQQRENLRLRKIIDTHLEDCDECNGTGEKENSVTVKGEFYGDCPVKCPFCEGTGKVTKS